MEMRDLEGSRAMDHDTKTVEVSGIVSFTKRLMAGKILDAHRCLGRIRRLVCSIRGVWDEASCSRFVPESLEF